MKMPDLKIVMRLICVGGVLLSCNFAEASLVTDKFPMLTYAEQNVPTYDKPGGGQKGFISPGVALVYIRQIRPDGWAYGSYPIANGKRIYRWFRMNELQGYLNFKNYEMAVESDLIVFRTSAGNSRLGSLKKNDKVIVIAERGDSKKIIYKVGGGNEFKMGWLTPGSSNSDTGSDNGNGDNEESNWNELLKSGKVTINVEGDLIVTGDNSTVKQNKIEGDSNQINNNEGDGDLTSTNITAGGHVAAGNGATVNENSNNDESVNKNATINSNNTTDSNNTSDSGNTNIATDTAQIKNERVREDKISEDKQIVEPKLSGELPGINNQLGNQNSADENSTKPNNTSTKSDKDKKG